MDPAPQLSSSLGQNASLRSSSSQERRQMRQSLAGSVSKSEDKSPLTLYLLENMELVQNALDNLFAQSAVLPFHDRPKLLEAINEEVAEAHDLYSEFDSIPDLSPKSLETKQQLEATFKQFLKKLSLWIEEIQEGFFNDHQQLIF